ncbi:aBC transporter substrate-binding protein [Bacteroides sp. CAG:1076]|nr:aBC transporter substrate-binding protein [Bacteroides sp. CAG:1076]
MKKYIILFLNLLVLMGCSSRQQQTQQATLTVSIEPLRYFTEAIAGDKFQVTSMVPEGSNPETYDPTPQQLVTLSQSVAFLRIGYIGFEQVWAEKLQSNAPNVKFFNLSEGVNLIREDDIHHGNHSHPGGVEPHIWSSTQNAYIIADNIFHALCTLDADHTAYYKENLAKLKQEITRTDNEIHTLLQNTSCAFLIYHPALSYFARDYGLEQICIEEGGKEPSPAHLQALIRRCKEKHVQVIFVQKEFDTRNAEIIARETGAKIVSINPLSYKWQKEMTTVAKALSE